MHKGKAVFRVGTMGMGRGVISVAMRKAPDGKGYQPRSQGPPQGPEGQRRDLRPRPPLSRANQRGEPGCQKLLNFYPAVRKEKAVPPRLAGDPQASRREDPAQLPRRPEMPARSSRRPAQPSALASGGSAMRCTRQRRHPRAIPLTHWGENNHKPPAPPRQTPPPRAAIPPASRCAPPPLCRNAATARACGRGQCRAPRPEGWR